MPGGGSCSWANVAGRPYITPDGSQAYYISKPNWTQADLMRFTLPEALGEGGVVKKLRGEHLEGYGPVEGRLVRLVDGGHTAAPERGDDAIRSEGGSGLEIHERLLARGALRLAEVAQ